MTYVLGKVAWLLGQPSSLMLLAVALGLALAASRRFCRAGWRLGLAGALALLVGGFSPLANVVILPLEERFPVPVLATDGGLAGIIVLGGAEVGAVGRARGQLTLNEAGERVTEGLRLAIASPGVRLIFTGGAARVFREDVAGASEVAQFWRTAGIADERIVVEDRSLTTWENAALTHALLKPKAGERYLLVTSAYHVPRAVGAFRKAGFDVLPYPVDFRTAGLADLRRGFDAFPKGLRRLDDSTREWAGMVGYWLTGRSSALFPAP